jgi:hypothetical protein
VVFGNCAVEVRLTNRSAVPSDVPPAALTHWSRHAIVPEAENGVTVLLNGLMAGGLQNAGHARNFRRLAPRLSGLV